MRRADLLSLQAYGYGERAYLYAVQRADGVFKIGRTRAPYTRMCLLFDRFRVEASPMVGVFLAQVDHMAPDAERHLVGLCNAAGQCVQGREYFIGLSWPAVREMVLAAAASKPLEARKAA